MLLQAPPPASVSYDFRYLWLTPETGLWKIAMGYCSHLTTHTESLEGLGISSCAASDTGTWFPCLISWWTLRHNYPPDLPCDISLKVPSVGVCLSSYLLKGRRWNFPALPIDSWLGTTPPTPRHKRQINKRKAVLVTNTQICLWKLHKDMKLKEVNRPESFYIF